MGQFASIDGLFQTFRCNVEAASYYRFAEQDGINGLVVDYTDVLTEIDMLEKEIEECFSDGVKWLI